MNEEILKENIIKNAQYLNSLLEQELYRIGNETKYMYPIKHYI